MVTKLLIDLQVPSYTQCPASGQSTLKRRIAAEEVAVTREPRGRRRQVSVTLDDDPPWTKVAMLPRLLDRSVPMSAFAAWKNGWHWSKTNRPRNGGATPRW